jgi:hypothetical protein
MSGGLPRFCGSFKLEPMLGKLANFMKWSRARTAAYMNSSRFRTISGELLS